MSKIPFEEMFPWRYVPQKSVFRFQKGALSFKARWIAFWQLTGPESSKEENSSSLIWKSKIELWMSGYNKIVKKWKFRLKNLKRNIKNKGKRDLRKHMIDSILKLSASKVIYWAMSLQTKIGNSAFSIHRYKKVFNCFFTWENTAPSEQYFFVNQIRALKIHWAKRFSFIRTDKNWIYCNLS